jgi:alpha-tubulin suppressor-like RCC1 family protein
MKGNENLFEPTPILGLEDVCEIVAGCRHAGTINKDGSIYVWGFNFHNQLGLGEND